MAESDTTPGVARKVITKEELRQLAEALDATNGNISQAADLLGWDKKRVYKAISKIQALKERFGPQTDPEDLMLKPADEIARAPVLSPSERALVRRQAEEEAALEKKDYSRLGLEPAQVKQLESLEKYAGITLSQSVRIAHGGQNKVMLGLLDMFDRFKKKLDDGQWPYTVTPEGDQVLDEAKGVQVLVGISAEVRALYGQLHKNQVLMIRAEELKNQGNGQSRGKPGFSPGGPPTLIQINGVKDVNVSQPGADAQL